VGGQVVPEEDHALAVNEAFELLEESDEADGVEAVFLVRANRRVFCPSQRKPSAAATEVLSQ
jgi:hypothetical protein